MFRLIAGVLVLRAVVLCVVLCARQKSFVGQGSTPSQGDQGAIPQVIAEKSDHVEFDIGTVSAGALIKHSFEFSNRTSGRLSIAKNEDIQVGCGCASLVPSARTVEPGEAATFTLSAKTDGKKGEIAYRSSVTWTAEDRTIHPFTMLVKGTVLPLIDFQPDVLSFQPADIAAGRTLEVLLVGNRFSKVEKWNVAGDNGAFHVSRIEVIDERTARATVECNMPADLEVDSGEIRASANVFNVNGASDWRPVTAVLPVQAHRALDLVITPTPLTVVTDPVTQDGRASLLLRGSLVARCPHLIKSASFDGCKVEWKLSSSAGSQTAVLTINIQKLAVGRPKNRELVLEVRERGDIRIPIVVPPQGGP